MSHLTDEQFEEIIQGLSTEPEHFETCNQCRELLDEKKAMANRLQGAFAGIKPDEQLSKKILKQLDNERLYSRGEFVKRLSNIRLRTIKWPATAAAVLIIVAFLGLYVISPSPAMAAKAELVKIHQHNLSMDHEFYSEADPQKLAEYFKAKLGFTPSMPVPDQGMALRGCCVRYFQGQVVGSYVVDTPRGVMSIVVVAKEPQSLGIGTEFIHQGQVYWKSSFAKSDIVSVRIGDYSYCAVGEVSHEYLTELLNRLF